MIELLAQTASPDWPTLIGQGGVVGIVIAFLMYQSVKRDERDAKRDAERDVRITELTGAIHQNTVQIGFLIRATTAEVMSRPSVIQRVREEMQEINRALDGKP